MSFRRRSLVSWAAALPLGGLVRSGAAATVTEADAATAIRQALERGALSAVALLGKTDGFLGNPKVRIPLPEYLEDAANLLRRFGQSKQIDELVTGMNRAAEHAVPEARALLVQTAKEVTLDDALRIVRGSDTSVTEYFAAKTRQPLGERFMPIVKQATEKVALADKYNAVVVRGSKFGLVKPEDADLQRYVTGKTLDGLYLMIGEEERKIRRDPVATGSAILRKVFGS